MTNIQARLREIRTQVTEIKRELRILMSDLEKTNLEAHVDLCAERYKGLHDRLSAIETSLKRLSDDVLEGQKSQSKTLIMTAGTVVAGLAQHHSSGINENQLIYIECTYTYLAMCEYSSLKSNICSFTNGSIKNTSYRVNYQ
jgi:hypothetical protein